jgi:signal peptidase I
MKARKGLSRILVEVLLILIALAAVVGAYFVYSLYAGSAYQNLSGMVESAYASGDRLIVNIKNTGTVKIDGASAQVVAGGSQTLTPPESVSIEPGQSAALEFTASANFEAGKTYSIAITIEGGSQSHTFVFSVTAF